MSQGNKDTPFSFHDVCNLATYSVTAEQQTDDGALSRKTFEEARRIKLQRAFENR